MHELALPEFLDGRAVALALDCGPIARVSGSAWVGHTMEWLGHGAGVFVDAVLELDLWRRWRRISKVDDDRVDVLRDDLEFLQGASETVS